jgi:hypothetical protein
VSGERVIVAYDDPDASRRWEAQAPRGTDPRLALDELIRRAYRLDEGLRRSLAELGVEPGREQEAVESLVRIGAEQYGSINGAPLLVG